MGREWSIRLADDNVDRFIRDHGLKVRDIRTQPFLGSDIRWESTDAGWDILLYPRMYYEGPTEETILHALSAINRRDRPWFEETPADEFDRLTAQFLDERRCTDPYERESQATEIVAIDAALCSALDLYYLLTRGYLNGAQLRHLADYRSANFVSVPVAVEFLASTAVLRVIGADLTELHEVFIRHKWYDLLAVLDRVENCVRMRRAIHADSIAILDILLPHLKERALHDTIAVLRRNVLGPRDDDEIDFDLAVSYASEDREVANRIADAVVRERFSIFYDQYMGPELWGKELHQHLTDVYRRRARFCLMIVSAHYAAKVWPQVERKAAVQRAVSENLDYILPVRLDDTAVPGLPPSVVYLDLREQDHEAVAAIIVKRLRLLG